MSILNKKAAMFGLDARIALAIFGALSVITGASLYSVITKLKVAAFSGELIEIGKAIEQYSIDTGITYPDSPYSTIFKDPYEINHSTKNGWKGPYFTFSESLGDTTYYARHKNLLGTTSSVTVKLYSKSRTSCSVGNCYLWLAMNYIPKQHGIGLKRYFDNTEDTSLIGKIAIKNQLSDYIEIYYNIMPMAE